MFSFTGRAVVSAGLVKLSYWPTLRASKTRQGPPTNRGPAFTRESSRRVNARGINHVSQSDKSQRARASEQLAQAFSINTVSPAKSSDRNFFRALRAMQN